MKKILLISALLFFCYSGFAQVPQAFSYQTVIRDSLGDLLSNTQVRFRFSIHDQTANGTIVYQEVHTVATDEFGLISLSIGSGTVIGPAFSSINWIIGEKYLQVELDITGGNNFTQVGNQKLLSVPYSLYSGNGLPTSGNAGSILYWNGSSWVSMTAGQPGQLLYYCNNQPQWGPCNFSVGDLYQGGKIAYIYKPGDPGYIPGQIHGIIAALNDMSSVADWGCYAIYYGITNSELGKGMANTNAIVFGCPSATAALMCDTLTTSGFSDWHLPDLDELYKLYLNKNLIGNFANDYYWSSSEYNRYTAYTVYFVDGSENAYVKYNTLKVRAIRDF